MSNTIGVVCEFTVTLYFFQTRESLFDSNIVFAERGDEALHARHLTVTAQDGFLPLLVLTRSTTLASRTPLISAATILPHRSK